MRTPFLSRIIPPVLGLLTGPGLVLAQGVVPVTLQWFESSWETMENRTADAFMAGYGRVWTPSICRGESGGYSIGYDVWDRFDLGSPGSPTRYGTRAGFEAVVAEQDRAGIATFVELILNHNAYSDNSTPNFIADGGYPGFVLDYGGDPHGDFHPRWDDCNANPIICRLAGLIDIAQEKNHVMIRHPVEAGNPQNIPAGTYRNRPDPANRQYYSDTGLPANSIGIHPFNTADPMAGDPVAENATGLLMRNLRWLLEVIRVDGFRIDATKHMPDWFLRDFFDRHVWNRAPGGGTPYSFMEHYEGNPSLIAGYVCKNGQGNCNTSGGVMGNRDALDFPLYFAMQNQLNGTGFGSWENIINASVDQIFDGNPNNGNWGVQFVSAHDQSTPPPAADNLAYAYILTRTGSPIVYFKAGEFGTVSFPRDGRGDALGGQYGNLITTLVDIHNEYARGDYFERRDAGNPSFADVLVFERYNQILVGINDRMDGGYDQRTVTTAFAAGTRLHELTGNARDAIVDPNNDIFDVVTVGSGGVVTIRVPRNRNPAGTLHHKGYVIYGPCNPDGDLIVSPVASVIPADPPSKPNGTRRLTPLEVITADSFEVRLETVDADPLDPGEDDLAMLKLDAGMDLNGNGVIDSTDPNFVGFLYEDFLTQRVTLKSGGINIGGVQKGLYRQIVNATTLAEGRHYLSVIAFRHRSGGVGSGTLPIFETWRKVLVIDRQPPAMQLLFPPAGTAITSTSYGFVVRCTDRTATSVHMFLDQPAGTDVVALAQGGQNPATKEDRDQFRRNFTSLGRGHHRLDVVAFEETGRAGVTTYTGIRVELGGFDGLGDLNNDGKINNLDIQPYVALVQAGNQFNPRADMNGDGLVDAGDNALFASKLIQSGMAASTVEALLRFAVKANGPTPKPSPPEPADRDDAEEVDHG